MWMLDGVRVSSDVGFGVNDALREVVGGGCGAEAIPLAEEGLRSWASSTGGRTSASLSHDLGIGPAVPSKRRFNPLDFLI